MVPAIAVSAFVIGYLTWIVCVTLQVASYFSASICLCICRQVPDGASMPMPVTALHLNDSPVLWKDQVWPAGQSFIVKPEPEAKSVQAAPDNQLRFGVLYRMPDIIRLRTSFETLSKLSPREGYRPPAEVGELLIVDSLRLPGSIGVMVEEIAVVFQFFQFNKVRS